MHEKSFSIVINQSKWLLIYLTIIHTVMLVIVLSLVSNIGLTLVAVVAISASFIFYCGQYQWLNNGRAIIEIGHDDKAKWRLVYSDGSSKDELELKHCVVTPQLVIVNFCGTRFWNAKSVTIVADSVDRELLRQLRVYLRNPKTSQQ